jgi:protein-disulfide isomerase
VDLAHALIGSDAVRAALSQPLDPDDHVLGPASAPLELVMYGDFQCPYCLGAQSVLSRVRDRLGDRLRFAFRHFPITGRHPLAQLAAEASEAAATRGLFWEYHDAVFAAQQRLTEELVAGLARELGVDGAELDAELREGRHAARVARDVRSGEASGVQGTPAFFVNGQRHEDAYDAGSLVDALSASATA